MFSREQMQRAIEDALKQMEGVALELYRRGREEAREELEQVTRERDEARANRASYTVGETEWTQRSAALEHMLSEERENVDTLRARVAELEAMKP